MVVYLFVLWNVDATYSIRVFQVDLPDYEQMRRQARGQLTPEEIRSIMKKEGIAPTRPYQEKPLLITTTGKYALC